MALITQSILCRWKPFDPIQNWPDLGPKFRNGEKVARDNMGESGHNMTADEDEGIKQDRRDLDWATVFKRTFESYIRGERPNMYGEWLVW